ncbi:MAG: alanine racemase [Anaerolineales bacterium]|nr:alanine racemase [Anaerolineales bacterium]
MHISNHPTISINGVLRPTYVEIDLERLTENYRAIQQQVGAAMVMPILKANAYGHGLIEVAMHMQKIDVPYLGVAYLEEGLLLREAGITTPILVLGGIIGSQVPLFIKNDLTLTASSIEKLEHVDRAAKQVGKQAKVHLKIDTGMERIGVHYYNAKDFLKASLDYKHIEVEGVFSHFANADSLDLASAKLQLERFNEVLKFYEDRALPVPIRHIANSGAVLQLPESYFELVRPGILTYGVYPAGDIPRSVPVSPALVWKSRVVYFKVVKPGHPVSYGSRWESDHMVRVVTVPVGYGDGYFRAMTGKAEVILRGKKYPVVGSICMDQMMVNIEWDSAYNDDEVILIGEAEGERITCEDLAEWAGTIPYEVLTNINTRVPRVYV